MGREGFENFAMANIWGHVMEHVWGEFQGAGVVGEGVVVIRS